MYQRKRNGDVDNIFNHNLKWWAEWDSNPHSMAYEATAFTLKLPAPIVNDSWFNLSANSCNNLINPRLPVSWNEVAECVEKFNEFFWRHNG